MNISGTNSGCFFDYRQGIQINKKKKLWEYHYKTNTWIYPTAFDLQTK